MRQRKPTEKEAETIQFIRRYIGRNGYAPFQREIAQHFNVGDMAIHKRLKRLEALGIISRDPDECRAIQVLKKPCSQCGEWKPETNEFFPRKRAGLSASCKACDCEAAKQWLRDNPERRRAWVIDNTRSQLVKKAERYHRKKRERIAAMAAQIRRTP